MSGVIEAAINIGAVAVGVIVGGISKDLVIVAIVMRRDRKLRETQLKRLEDWEANTEDQGFGSILPTSTLSDEQPPEHGYR